MHLSWTEIYQRNPELWASAEDAGPYVHRPSWRARERALQASESETVVEGGEGFGERDRVWREDASELRAPVRFHSDGLAGNACEGRTAPGFSLGPRVVETSA